MSLLTHHRRVSIMQMRPNNYDLENLMAVLKVEQLVECHNDTSMSNLPRAFRRTLTSILKDRIRQRRKKAA